MNDIQTNKNTEEKQSKLTSSIQRRPTDSKALHCEEL